MTLATHQPHGPHVKRWTKREYNQHVEQGWFTGKRLFLFRGELIEMPPMGSPHAWSLTSVSGVLFELFHPDEVVRVQMPFEVPGESMPEPDAAVVTKASAMRLPHPNEAMLIVEVSDTSYDFDCEKALEYAAAGVPDYWIIDVNRRCLVVHRSPLPDTSAFLGYRYAQRREFAEHESVAPLARLQTQIAVARLLP
jgi:Uma2 family endonuclease